MQEEPRPRRQHREERPAGRRKRSNAARVSWAMLYALFILGASAILATVSWVWANDVLALNKDYTSVIITIDTEKQSFSDIVDELADKGIIEHKEIFKFYCHFSDAQAKISSGTYELNTDMDYRAIVTNLSANSATMQTVDVTIPEGYTEAQVFALLEKNGVANVDELTTAASEHDYQFTWLKDVPLGDAKRLEGFLFPDTYTFYQGEDPVYVLNKMLVNFDGKMSEYLDKISETNYSLRDVVTIASIIEEETDGEDQQDIASVIYNRLENTDGPTKGYLQMDSTIQYLLDTRKAQLTTEDLAIDSPYNTYLYAGLPAGPISNPGMTSLYAAMNPNSTKYYYFLLEADGTTHFFKSYDSFLKAKEALAS